MKDARKDQPDWATLGVLVPLVIVILLFFMLSGWFESELRLRVSDTSCLLETLSLSLIDGHRRMGTLPPELKMATEDRDLRDVFSREKEDIRWWRFNENEGLLLSVGPDHILNATHGETPIVYSPTNGTKSSGDIIHWVRAPMPTMP